MNRFLAPLLALFVFSTASNAAGTREFDYFRPHERSQPLVLPELYSLSKFGRGLFRIDSLEHSRGQLNCIFLTFVASAPEGTTATTKPQWKTEHVDIDGKAVIRRSAVLLNPFSRAAGPEGDVLVIRIDAISEEIAATLRKIVDGFLPH